MGFFVQKVFRPGWVTVRLWYVDSMERKGRGRVYGVSVVLKNIKGDLLVMWGFYGFGVEVEYREVWER